MDNKYMAHHLVTCAIRNGVLKPEPCLVCHRPCGRGKKKTHAHHFSHHKPPLLARKNTTNFLQLQEVYYKWCGYAQVVTKRYTLV